MDVQRIRYLEISGFKAFDAFTAALNPLEIIVGANGAGKTSLFEFLRFLRDASKRPITPEIIPGHPGQIFFHKGLSEFLGWRLEIGAAIDVFFEYEGSLSGPVGASKIDYESIRNSGLPYIAREGKRASLQSEIGSVEYDYELGLRDSILALSLDRRLYSVAAVQRHVNGCQFYSSFKLDSKVLREAAVVDEHPVLSEDGGNLAAVLHYLSTEHQAAFVELQEHLRNVVPGFKRLSVKSRGGPGRVMAFWEEEGVDQPLTLADVSDGTLRLLCWMTLALAPNSPTLVCIDEPDQGVHPRTLPKLAALFKKLSERTQVLLATHNSYFLSQFDLEQIAVMRKENGRAVWIKPGDSAALRANLDEFGVDELERMHRSDELEHLS